MKLPLDRFNPAVRDSVLVALDLLVVNDKAEVLVGRRKQSPGGIGCLCLVSASIKEELLTKALPRISVSETGVDLSQTAGSLYGVYERLYPNFGFGEAGLSTHYAVIACLFENCPPVDFPGDRQHEYLSR